MPENDRIREMAGKMESSYDMLQDLDIKPTRKNMEILLKVLYNVQDVYNGLQTMQAETKGGD